MPRTTTSTEGIRKRQTCQGYNSVREYRKRNVNVSRVSKSGGSEGIEAAERKDLKIRAGTNEGGKGE